MIVIIDYNAGNPASILNMLKRAGKEAVISSEKSVVEQASKLILPGVGAFDYGMNNLLNSGLLQTLNQKVLEQRVPFLGICLGMQLLMAGSEEGREPGLGWIEGQAVRFDNTHPNLKVPHMGWNFLQMKKESRLFTGMFEDPRFYFVHSYFVRCSQEADVLCTTDHQTPFVSGIEKGNIAGVQFHPEKSHKYGICLLKNFADNF
jgi:glutamine amidotransferase